MHSALAFTIAAVVTYLLTPLAIRVALRTGFVDTPAGYKGHLSPTPYLGGCALMLGALAGAAVGSVPQRFDVVIACVGFVWVLGTVDDRVSLPIVLRLAAEVAVALVIVLSGHGWDVFHQRVADGALSLFWIVGLMNAFNLMDNMDGASATVAAVSSLGIGTLALLGGRLGLTPLCFAAAGACVGFLPRNLANPARIFMGDGGSLPLGLLVGAATMAAVNRRYLGPSGVVIGALLVAMVILDTTLVTISRSRAGRPVLSGGRDHLTHRLANHLGSPQRVALALALTQLVVCGVTITVAQAGAGWVLLAGGLALVLAAVLIWHFESSPLFKPESPSQPAADPAKPPGAEDSAGLAPQRHGSVVLQ